MPESSKGRRPRRQFDEEFRNEAVRLVLDDHKTVGAVARDLDLTASALRLWVRRAQADRTHGRTGLTTAEREELARLRKENRELRTERDILKNEFRAQVRPDLWARNSVAYARPPEAVAVRFLVTFTSPLKNMVRGWPAHLSVVTPQGDPV
jgi:transposase